MFLFRKMIFFVFRLLHFKLQVEGKPFCHELTDLLTLQSVTISNQEKTGLERGYEIRLVQKSILVNFWLSVGFSRQTETSESYIWLVLLRLGLAPIIRISF